ncbi:hypothetical protein [Bradyrhizobium sp. S69]|uniref:hypothetical protein n=1 Tax=Bradyrhizobium sp. S69 TaxID=1641856 RepID=UPI00131BA147|nr:hypothetical protein [Bradyrhizobium sp. S69]
MRSFIVGANWQNPVLIGDLDDVGGIVVRSSLENLLVVTRSNMLASETFKALQISNKRAALTRITPLSYF